MMTCQVNICIAAVLNSVECSVCRFNAKLSVGCIANFLSQMCFVFSVICNVLRSCSCVYLYNMMVCMCIFHVLYTMHCIVRCSGVCCRV